MSAPGARYSALDLIQFPRPSEPTETRDEDLGTVLACRKVYNFDVSYHLRQVETSSSSSPGMCRHCIAERPVSAAVAAAT